jgi:hypothetical protein
MCMYVYTLWGFIRGNGDNNIKKEYDKKDIAANILVLCSLSTSQMLEILKCFTLVELVGVFRLLLLVHQVSQYH